MTAPIKILVVITGLGTGGAEAMLVKLAERIDRSRFALSVLSLLDRGTRGDDLERLGIAVECLNLRGLLSIPSALLKLRSIVRRERPLLLQGWMYHGNFAASCARLFACEGTRVLWNVRHSLHDLSYESWPLRLLIRASVPLSRSLSRTLYPSRIALEQHARIGFDSARALVIPNGFDLARFVPPTDTERRSVRASLGIADDAFVIAHVARFHPMKDHSGFLRAVSLLTDALPNLLVLMAGTGVSTANPALATELDSLQLQGRVNLLGELRDVRPALAAADVFCLSSAWGEAFPNVLGEALAMGLPCVATDVGDSAAIVGDCGIVVGSRDPNAFALAVKRLATQPRDAMALLRRRARERVTSEYSVESVVRRYQQCFEEAAAGEQSAQCSCPRVGGLRG